MIHPLLSIQARSQAFLLRHFKYTSHGRYMKKIHNTHLGESCFVIGNGPSLSAVDLTTLLNMNIDTFAVNRIMKIFSQTNWRPTYYVSTDAVLIRDIIPEVESLNSEKFIPLQNKYYLNIKVKGAHYFLDCTEQVNMRGTVTIACIQLAIHMGYRHIYLLGIDHNFDKIITESGEIIIDPSVKNYFCEGYDDDVSNEVQHDIGTTTKAYHDVQRFCKKNNIEVINASRFTKLDAFPTLSFEKALEQIKQRNKI